MTISPLNQICIMESKIMIVVALPQLNYPSVDVGAAPSKPPLLSPEHLCLNSLILARSTTQILLSVHLPISSSFSVLSYLCYSQPHTNTASFCDKVQ